MRKVVKRKSKSGDLRVITWFLFFPRTLETSMGILERRWWERANIVQRCHHSFKWENVRWYD